MINIYFLKNWHKAASKLPAIERAPIPHLFCGIVYSALQR